MDIANLIDLPAITVIDVTRNAKGHVFITVETTEKYVACRVCGKHLTKRHGYDKERQLRHLPIFGNQTYIIYKARRYICEDCDNNPTTTATPIWHKPDSQFTIDYENNAPMQLVNSTIADVAIKDELTHSQVLGMLNRYIESAVNWNRVHTIDVLGIDEIALKKGHHDFITLVTARHDGVNRLLAVLEGQKKSTVKAFLKSIPKSLKKTITAICTDMYNGYINAAKEGFKKQTIVVVDRFHVAKQYRGELDKYRQKILKQLKCTLPEHEYKTLKGAMYILKRNNECLTKAEKRRLIFYFRMRQSWQKPIALQSS